MRCASRRPTPLRMPAQISTRFSPRAATATWAGSPTPPSAARVPARFGPDARSVILLGLNYGRGGDPLAILDERSRGAISIYAQGADYHDAIKTKLKSLAAQVQALAGGEVKVFVDTAPVMEKPLAAKAGLGWQGKHTNLVSREFGSWLFIGSIFTSAEIAPDERGRRSLRRVPALSRYLSDRRAPLALPHGCARVHLLPHHRAQRAHRAALSRGHGQPHLRLRRLPRRVPVEQVRASFA